MMAFSDSPTLAPEVAVAIEINGISFAVMMLSPHDLDDFAIGFLYSEGLIEQLYDVHNIEQYDEAQGIRLCVQLSQRQFALFKQNQRQLKGPSGCGICGKTALAGLFPSLNALKKREPIDVSLLTNLKNKIDKHQSLAKKSGAMHGAFLLDNQANILLCKEDIGRHNALDKLIGASIKSKQLKLSSAILITSRISADLVQKAISAKINTLIGLASPSTLALDMANQYGLHLSLIHI